MHYRKFDFWIYFGIWILAFGFFSPLFGGGGEEVRAQSVTPVISVSAPFAGAEWIQGKQYQIIWAQENTDRVSIGWGDCGVCTKWLVEDLGVDVNARSGFYTWTVPEDARVGENYRITIIGKKGDVTAASVESGIFKIVENTELRSDLMIESAQIGTRTSDTQAFREQELSDKDDGWARLWVKNQGRRPSGEWSYAVSIAGEAGSAQSLKYRSLAPGEGMEIFYHLGIRNAGTMDILFFTDPGSEIVELDEGNNGLRKIFLIKETGIKPDLVLVTVNAQTDKDGVVSELAMTVRVRNLSPLGDPINVRVRASTMGREYGREYSRLLLSPQNTVLGLPGSPWPAGNYTVEVELDPDKRIDEESEANNKLLVAVTMGTFVGFPKTAQETSRPTPFETITPSPEPAPIPPQTVRVNPALVRRLKGRILLQAEGRGELWYVDPLSGGRYFLGTGEAAMRVLRRKGLGITNRDLEKIPLGTAERKGAGTSLIDARLAQRLEGRILLQVQGRGEAWYVYRGKRYYLKGGEMTVQILKQFMLGVRNADLEKIPIGE